MFLLSNEKTALPEQSGHRKTIKNSIFVSYAGITRIRFKGGGDSILSVSAGKTQPPYNNMDINIFVGVCQCLMTNSAKNFCLGR